MPRKPKPRTRHETVLRCPLGDACRIGEPTWRILRRLSAAETKGFQADFDGAHRGCRSG